MNDGRNGFQYLVGIDVGGTFIDLIVMGEFGVDLVKVPSVPDDLVGSVLSGLDHLAVRHGLTVEGLLGNLNRLVHGTTIAANALIERKGAHAGFITTKGFKDTLVMRRMFRENMYDTRAPEPEPLITRDNIFEVEERLDRGGEVVTPLDTDAVARIVEEIKRRGLESVGVCFLFSFRNPDHEREVKALLARDAPDLYISTSCDVCPEIRDYERACTTHINAYVQPATDRYLRAVDLELKKSGMTATLEVMESNGGVSDPATASQRAVNMLLSGPVGGVMGGAYLGNRTGYRNLISFDMGGTSCDISLIQDGQATLSTPITSTATHCKFEGWDVLIPFIDIHTIGSGGGSVAWLDDVGALHVGPESMGAEPGPACYGKGGESATVTDADVVLGYIDPDYYLGGQIALDADRARHAVEKIGTAFGTSTTDAADGIFQIVNANMINGIRVVSVEKGHDPRDFALLSFGGAGAVHATALIEEMGVDRVVIPQLAAGFSAFGLLCTDLHRDFVTTLHGFVAELKIRDINKAFKAMEQKGRRYFRSGGNEDRDVRFEYAADMRYQRQSHDIRVALDAPIRSKRQIVESFNRTYHDSYGYLLDEAAIQLVNLRVSAYQVCEKPAFKAKRRSAVTGDGAVKGRRPVYFTERGRFVQTKVYDGHALKPGNGLKGPAVVELATTTIVVRPGQNLVVDPYRNYVVTRKGVQP